MLASVRRIKYNTELIVNTYGPRLNKQMKIIQDSGCVSIFSGILKDDNDKREEYVGIGRVEKKRVEIDKVIRVGVLVERWMAGDLLFFAMALGEEGSASHWCTYCDTSSALWKMEGSIEGQPWTLGKLNEDLKRLESGELNKRNIDERKGVSLEALFYFVDIDHYVMPSLHLMLGIVNYLYKKMVEEAQADCEGYSLDYFEAERIRALSKYNAATAKTNKKTFQATN